MSEHPRVPRLARLPLPWVVAASVFATYLLAARGPRNLFPLSVFDMYQGHAEAFAARVIVLDASGRAAELDDFESWSCSWQADLQHVDTTCGQRHRPLEYVTRDQARQIEGRAGDGVEPVRLVSRAYDVADPTRFEDCVLAQCRATRRPR